MRCAWICVVGWFGFTMHNIFMEFVRVCVRVCVRPHGGGTSMKDVHSESHPRVLNPPTTHTTPHTTTHHCALLPRRPHQRVCGERGEPEADCRRGTAPGHACGCAGGDEWRSGQVRQCTAVQVVRGTCSGRRYLDASLHGCSGPLQLTEVIV